MVKSDEALLAGAFLVGELKPLLVASDCRLKERGGRLR
jgi:hypothetical protein